MFVQLRKWIPASHNLVVLNRKKCSSQLHWNVTTYFWHIAQSKACNSGSSTFSGNDSLVNEFRTAVVLVQNVIFNVLIVQCYHSHHGQERCSQEQGHCFRGGGQIIMQTAICWSSRCCQRLSDSINCSSALSNTCLFTWQDLYLHYLTRVASVPLNDKSKRASSTNLHAAKCGMCSIHLL